MVINVAFNPFPGMPNFTPPAVTSPNIIILPLLGKTRFMKLQHDAHHDVNVRVTRWAFRNVKDNKLYLVN